MHKPDEIIIATFNDEKTANEALSAFKRWASTVDMKVINAAVMVKDQKGKTTVRQDEDVEPLEGTLFGAVVGGLIGLFGGPLGAAVGAAAGAATGGVTAAVVKMGFTDEEIKAIQNSLRPGSSALVALIEPQWMEAARQELNRYPCQIWSRTLPESYLEHYGREGTRESMRETTRTPRR